MTAVLYTFMLAATVVEAQPETYTAQAYHQERVASSVSGAEFEFVRYRSYRLAEAKACEQIAARLKSRIAASNNLQKSSIEGARRKSMSSSFSRESDISGLLYVVESYDESYKDGSYEVRIALSWNRSHQGTWESTRYGSIAPAEDWKKELTLYLNKFDDASVPPYGCFVDSNGYVHIFASSTTPCERNGEISNRTIEQSEMNIRSRIQLAKSGSGQAKSSISLEHSVVGETSQLNRSRDIETERKAVGVQSPFAVLRERRITSPHSGTSLFVTIAAAEPMISPMVLEEKKPDVSNRKKRENKKIFNPATGKFE